ncbi:MAG TPA: histidine kinase [Rugosimonospora sp.]|nr:histidine kinase [Rugosimonospora sp.]
MSRLPRALPQPLVNAGLVVLCLLDTVFQTGTENRLGLACGTVGATALLLRRKAPSIVLLVTLPAVLFAWALYAALIALFTLATQTRNRVLLGCYAATFATCYMVPWPIVKLNILNNPTNLALLGYGLATAAAPVFLGQLVQVRADLAARITEITEAREHERLLTAQSALAKDRAQLAREMHDVVSHQVSLIAVRAGALQVSTPDPHAMEAATTIRRLSVQTLDELRYMVSVLRASGSLPTELTPQPTLAQLPELVAGSAIEAQLALHVPASGDLPPPVQRAIYRTVQEGLTNVRKHAPGSTATVEIHQGATQIRTTVTNTAPTRPVIPLPSAHHGLAGLRQRAELLGGTLQAHAVSGNGFQLSLDLPVEGRADTNDYGSHPSKRH